MKIFITGGAGFIGSHIAEFYAKQGESVTIYDNLSRGRLLRRELDAMANVKYLRKYDNVEFTEGDIRDRKVMAVHAKNADVIFHAAAQTAVTTSLTEPSTDFSVNALGTLNVLEAARQNGSTVIYTSTNKVYGDNVNNLELTEKESRYEYNTNGAITERLPIDHTGHSPYGSSKLSADIYTQDYHHTYGLRTAVFRMSCIYGLRQQGCEDQAWISHFIKSIMNDRSITIYGDGKQVRDVLFVDDLVNVFDLWLKSDSKHDIYNIGGGKKNTLSLIELIDFIESKTGKKAKIKHEDWRASDQKVYISNIRKAHENLGWSPKIDAHTGVSMLIEEERK